MCGIFGVLNAASDAGLEACARTLDHRGPDGFGSHFSQEEKIYLAHCRLAIIDLSDAGRQPMANEERTIWLTFNGEIYNFRELRAELQRSGHVFRTGTDSEVVIHAYAEWGIECIRRFNGMFAFGLWDARSKKFFLVRDRVGIKPLYYAFLDGQLAFASEAKALVRLPKYQRSVHAGALQSFLIYSYVAGQDSIWNNIKRLAPGAVLAFDLATGALAISSYWKLEDSLRQRTAVDIVDEFREVLSQAVSSHLISDVPLGVFLSGGIDSTAVASMAAHHQAGIDTISIGFSGAASDELAVARQTAGQIGAASHQHSVSLDRFDQLMEVFTFLDEPLGDHAIFPTYLMSKEARQLVKVTLSGDGGDELFGGYSWYFNTVKARKMKQQLFRAGALLGRSITGLCTTFKRMDQYQHYLMLNSPGFTAAEIRALFPSLESDFREQDEAYLFKAHHLAELEPFKSWQVVDFHTYLVDNNLAKLDRVSMACSLEARVPLLDHRLVELAFSLPDSQCVGNEGKFVLREYLRMQGLLHVLSLPKRGFSFDVNQLWPLAEMVVLLSSSHMARDGFADARSLSHAVHGNRTINYPFRIWLLAVLEMWYRHWME